MNTEATEPTSGLSPASMRRSMPRRYASAAATYCSRENSSVTLIGTPAKIASSMAGRPSLVPGILMNRLGRPARACKSLAAASVLAVSWASSGDTSSDTQPSTPFGPLPDRSKQVGGPGEVLERQVEEQLPRPTCRLELLADGGVVGGAVLDGVVEDRRVRGEPRHRQLVDVAFERAAVQQVAGDVVEPEALAQVVELLVAFMSLPRGVQGQ